MGIELPFSCKIGGIRLVHQNGIVFNGGIVIGENCTIYYQVTIGMNELSDKKGAPHIGSNVYIGCGAKLIGKIAIGDNCRIGANAVVVKDMEEGTMAICRMEIIGA